MNRILVKFWLVVIVCYVSAFVPKANKMSMTQSLPMGLFDGLFKEDPEERARKEAEKEEMMRAQKEILERRRNPKKMREYEENYEERRKDYARERAIYNFQNADGGDPLEEFMDKKRRGLIKVSEETRDPGSSRLGSEGLSSVRTDERMPYIDRGYVPGEKTPPQKAVDSAGENGKEDDDDAPKVRVGKKKATLSAEERTAAYAPPAEGDDADAPSSSKAAEDPLGDMMKGFNDLFKK